MTIVARKPEFSYQITKRLPKKDLFAVVNCSLFATCSGVGTVVFALCPVVSVVSVVFVFCCACCLRVVCLLSFVPPPPPPERE